MNSRRPVQNQRRSRRSKNLLEVSVRSQFANKQRNRRMAVWVCKLMLVVGLVSGAVYGAKEGMRRFFWENPKYHLAAVEIHNPGASLNREIILEAANLQLGVNLFELNLSKAQESLTALPQVQGAELRRVLPNKVAIEITERRPIAWLVENDVQDAAAADSSFLIDANGYVFRPKQMMSTYLRLPVIYGVPPQNYLPGDKVNVPELTSAIELISRNGETGRVGIEVVDLRKGYCILVTDARGRRISFPLDEAALHLDRLAVVLEATSSRGMEVQTVNLLVRQNVPVTLVNHSESALPPAPIKATLPAKSGSSSAPEPVAEKEKASEPEVKKEEAPKPSPRSTPANRRNNTRATAQRQNSTRSQTASRTPRKQEARRATPASVTEPFIPRAEPVRR